MSTVILRGDCVERMRELPDCSVDACVTDPPYGLSAEPDIAEVLRHWLAGDDYTHKGSGFMGKTWDSFVPGPSVWTEALRVLKPGGHALVFAGTRTVDLMAISLRMAGFQIRDQLAWAYGCLTSDVEVLTRNGWVPGIHMVVGTEVACWDPATEAISLQPTQEVICKPYDGKLRHLKNDDTDQTLTPNHRVYQQTQERRQEDGIRESTWTEGWHVAEAADVSRWKPTRLPLAGYAEGEGIGGRDWAALLGWVWTEGGYDKTGTGVRIYQSSVNQDRVDEIDGLLRRVAPGHRRYDRERTYDGRDYTETCWYISGPVAERVRADLPSKRPTWELLWRLRQDEREALWDAAKKGDGDRNGYGFHQRDERDLVWAQTLLATMGQRGKIAMRGDREGGTLTWTARATTELQARHLKAKDVDYTGHVWCLRVPTGAFVCRAMGRIFITGNSGFPKSRNIGKAIDAEAGVEREDLGPKLGRDGKEQRHGANANRSGGIMGEASGGPRKADRIRPPATPEAEQWEGWGTALKPAYEPIILARKPLSERTLASNVLAHGTGALNIEDSRIPCDEGDKSAERKANGYSADAASALGHREEVTGFNGDPSGADSTEGRWPANILVDEQAAEHFDELSGELRTAGNKELAAPTSGGRLQVPNMAKAPSVVYGDKGGASRFFYCAKASTAEREAGLHELPVQEVHRYGAGIGEGDDPDAPALNRNPHPTVKPIDLMRYLITLITPPGGRVLDPFLGSGTTGCAAHLTGHDFIGCELSDEYADVAERRIEWWQTIPEGTDTAEAARTGTREAKVAETGQLGLLG